VLVGCTRGKRAGGLQWLSIKVIASSGLLEACSLGRLRWLAGRVVAIVIMGRRVAAMRTSAAAPARVARPRAVAPLPAATALHPAMQATVAPRAREEEVAKAALTLPEWPVKEQHTPLAQTQAGRAQVQAGRAQVQAGRAQARRVLARVRAGRAQVRAVQAGRARMRAGRAQVQAV
jgi:hypothetical protein